MAFNKSFQSYYPDGGQKDMQARSESLTHFIASIRELQSGVDDPSDVLGDAIKSLDKYAEMFENNIDSNYTADHMEIPKQSAPTTRDNNVIYVDPFPGPYSPPNPLMPKNWPKDLRVSFGAQNADDTSTSGKSPARILSNFVDGKRVTPAVDTSPAQSDSPAKASAGQPVPPWSVPTPWNLRDLSVASGNNDWSNSPALALVAGNMTQAAAPNASASAPPLAPSNEPDGSAYPVGAGLAGWIATLAGHPFSTR